MMDLGPTGLAAARRALSPPPLWVGRRFSGFRLSSIESGLAKTRGVNGVVLSSVPYVRLTYQVTPDRQLVLEEFNPASLTLAPQPRLRRAARPLSRPVGGAAQRTVGK